MMRTRLTMKLVGLAVAVVLTIFSAHALGGGSHTSPLDPSTLTRNGLNSLCANQQATAAASGDTSPQTLPDPASMPNLGSLAQAAGLPPGSLSCSTTTTSVP